MKLKQTITLMPDGSGKVQYIVGFSKQVFELGEGEDALAQYSPDALGERTKGIAFYTKPIRYEDAGWEYLAFSGYFEDINDVVLAGPDNGGKPARFAYEPNEDGGASLKLTGGVILSIAQDFEPIEPEDRERLRELLKGMELTEQFILPGDADEVEGVVELGNGTVALRIDVKQLMAEDGPVASLRDAESVVFEMGRFNVTPEQVAAFKAEWAKAKAEQEMQPEAEEED